MQNLATSKDDGYIYKMKNHVLSVILLSTFPFLLLADDWPGFLGPDRTGVSKETLPAKPAPEVIWKREIGIGFSSISVVGDRAYAMGHQDGKETVFCFDALSGEVVWRHSYEGELLPNLHEGGPAATPMIDGEQLFTVGKQGQMFSLNRHNGDITWEQDLREVFEVKVPEWGFSASPLVDGNRLLLDLGPTVCIHKLTGKKVWATEAYKAGYGSVMRFEQEGESYYGTLNNDGLIIVDPINGESLAFYKWPTSFDTNATTPLYHEGRLFVSTAYNKGCGLFTFDEGQIKVVYENKEMRNHMNNSILYGDYLFGFDRKAHNRRLVKLRCMKWDTGEITWSVENLGCGSLIRAGEHLVVLSDQGELLVARANPEAFEPIVRKNVLDGKCWTPPALANGVVYARNAKGTLVAVKL